MEKRAEEGPKGAITKIETTGLDDPGDLFRPWAAPCFGISVLSGFIGAGSAYAGSVLIRGFKASNTVKTWRYMHIGFVSLFLIRWISCETQVSRLEIQAPVSSGVFTQNFSKEFYENPPDDIVRPNKQ